MKTLALALAFTLSTAAVAADPRDAKKAAVVAKAKEKAREAALAAERAAAAARRAAAHATKTPHARPAQPAPHSPRPVAARPRPSSHVPAATRATDARGATDGRVADATDATSANDATDANEAARDVAAPAEGAAPVEQRADDVYGARGDTVSYAPVRGERVVTERLVSERIVEAPLLARITNNDAGVSVVAPASMLGFDGGSSVAIALVAPDKSADLMVSRDVYPSEAFRAACADGAARFELWNVDAGELCLAKNDAGITLAQVRLADGHVVSSRTTTDDAKAFAQAIQKIAATVRVVPGSTL